MFRSSSLRRVYDGLLLLLLVSEGKVMLKGFLSIFGMRMPFFSWAGRSVWYDRSVGIAEAAGSNPAPSTISEL